MTITHEIDDSQLIDGSATMAVMQEIINERIRQDAKWGQQNPPDGTGPNTAPLVSIRALTADYDADAQSLANHFTRETDRAFSANPETGPGTWRHILLEEVFEAMAESDPLRLRTELRQVAAVAAAWDEAIGRRAHE